MVMVYVIIYFLLCKGGFSSVKDMSVVIIATKRDSSGIDMCKKDSPQLTKEFMKMNISL